MRRILFIVVLFLLVATPLKWFSNQLGDKLRYSSPCSSSSQARLWRVYVCRATFHPSVITHGGETIDIREAWVEKRSKRRYLFVWIPYRQDRGGYQLCFTLKQGHAVFRGASPPFWVVGDLGHSFGSINESELFYETLEALPSEIKVSLVNSWKDLRPKNIRITVDRPK